MASLSAAAPWAGITAAARATPPSAAASAERSGERPAELRRGAGAVSSAHPAPAAAPPRSPPPPPPPPPGARPGRAGPKARGGTRLGPSGGGNTAAPPPPPPPPPVREAAENTRGASASLCGAGRSPLHSLPAAPRLALPAPAFPAAAGGRSQQRLPPSSACSRFALHSHVTECLQGRRFNAIRAVCLRKAHVNDWRSPPTRKCFLEWCLRQNTLNLNPDKTGDADGKADVLDGLDLLQWMKWSWHSKVKTKEVYLVSHHLR
ncbi:uncharacterized protein LOC143838522 [Paroedura picta]|uniref:uncharacterized protein LOC143838522 n=1 Tax=Paroedura picta TaxID=143630 RepID=UPI004057662D